LTSELISAYKQCGRITREQAGNFYYAFLFLPKLKRWAIYALYAFCQLGDGLVDEGNEPSSTRQSLDRLRSDFRACLEGNYRSPVYRALGDSIRRFKLPEKHFLDLIAGMESDLTVNRFQDFPQLREYCYKVASTVGLLCVEIFGYNDEQVKIYAENLGIALQLTNIIRDVGEDFQRGRIYLPQEDIQKFACKEEDFKKGNIAGNFQNLMEYQYRRAREFYLLAERALPPQELKIQIASEIMKNIYKELLESIRKQNFPVLNKRVKLSAWKKLLTAMQTSWAINNGRMLSQS
jgi:phytoene synthase